MEDLKNIINSAINIEKKNADAKYGEFKSNEYALLTLKEESRELELETGIIMDNIEYLNGIHLKYLNKTDCKIIKEIRRRAVLAACEAIQVATVCDRWLEKLSQNRLKIGLIFDDPPKITCLMSAVHMGVKNSYYSLIPIELPLLESEEDMVRSIIDSDIDAVIVDADLAAPYSGVNLASPYSGVSLACRLTSIPVFLLTTYPEEWKKIKGYEVFEFGKYLENPSGLNAKIIEKCKRNEVKETKMFLNKKPPLESGSKRLC